MTPQLADIIAMREGRRPFMDLEWFAIDTDGSLAVFITSGFAAVPLCALADEGKFQALSAEIHHLPATSAVIPVYYPMAELAPSFVEFAAQGLYVYDWDHQISWYEPNLPYSLMARPQNPIHWKQLGNVPAPPDLPLHFEKSPHITIEQHFRELNV